MTQAVTLRQAPRWPALRHSAPCPLPHTVVLGWQSKGWDRAHGDLRCAGEVLRQGSQGSFWND